MLQNQTILLEVIMSNGDLVVFSDICVRLKREHEMRRIHPK